MITFKFHASTLCICTQSSWHTWLSVMWSGSFFLKQKESLTKDLFSLYLGVRLIRHTIDCPVERFNVISRGNNPLIKPGTMVVATYTSRLLVYGNGWLTQINSEKLIVCLKGGDIKPLVQNYKDVYCIMLLGGTFHNPLPLSNSAYTHSIWMLS